MLRYIFKRILMMIPVLLGVLFLVFTMNEISPGDPAAMIAGDAASVEVVEQIREDLGLNKPLPVRFLIILKISYSMAIWAHPIRQNVLFWMKLWIGCLQPYFCH